MQDEQWPPKSLIDMMMKLSDGDISVLVAAVAKKSASMATPVGSRNYEFWTKLAEIGLLKEEGSLPGAELIDARLFSVVQDEILGLEQLLEAYRKRLIATKMAHFLNAECEPFAAKTVEHVKSAGGDAGDIIALMGLLLTSVLSKSFPRQNREQIVQHIADLARKQLKELP